MARRLGILLLFVATALLAVTAYWLLFTVFMAYDDEGYVLISLQNYSAHGGLYAQVYSQYGPFFYFLHDLGHRLLGYGFTNTNGRLITLLCWLLTAGASAHLVWRQTRALTLTGFTLGLTFFHLWLMVSEPLHPGGMIAALVATGAWLGAWLIERRAMTVLAVSAGLIGAALLLTKVNVGVFFLASAGAWFAVQLANPRHARDASLLSALLLVILPLGLMRTQLDAEWGRLFGGLAVVSAVTMLAAAWRERQPLTAWSQAAWGGASLLLLGGIVLATVCLRGTSLPELLDGILLGPLRHPGVYHFPPAWKPGAALAGGASLLLAAVVWRGHGRRLDGLFVLLRLVLVLVYGLASLEWLPFTSRSFTMSYLVPFAWIFTLRLGPAGAADSCRRGATWVGLLLVLQYLHAYPVAGSQVAWGTFLIVPLMALGLHDTGCYLAARGRPHFPVILGTVCAGLALGVAGRLAVLGGQRYADSRPLRLTGAEGLRLPEDFSSTLRLLTLNATAHGDMLFSLPGLFSFNTWAQLPPPTLADTTHWFTLLSPRQQEEIAAALTRSERPVLIVQRGLLEFLAANQFSTASPLEDYLHRNFQKAFGLQQYEFWVRRGRSIALLGTAGLMRLGAPQPGLPPARLEIIAAIPAGRTVARIELATLNEAPRVLAGWDKSTGPLSWTGLDLHGTPLTTGNNSAWEQPLPPLVRLVLPLAQVPVLDPRHTVFYLRDASGSLLAEARFTD